MSAEQMSFKAMIKRIANEEQIPAQVVLQNFMFERFFARLSKTAIRENLIVSVCPLNHRLSKIRQSA